MNSKFAILIVASISVASGGLILSNTSPAVSGHETTEQKIDKPREATEWARAWCTSPRRAIDHRCSNAGTR
jgi:hypothetical protein